MQIGYKTLNLSADIYEEGEDPINSKKSFFQNIMESISNIIAIIFAVSLFILLPLFTTTYIIDDINQPIYFNIISGIIRITIFLVYLLLISQLDDVKKLFQYHGAEHKTVYNFEKI